MTVWFCIPSKRTPEQVKPILKLWRERGYKIALFRDEGDPAIVCDFGIREKYRGYAAAVNRLAREALARDPQAQWIVTGGDDTEPEPNKTAEEIARECTEHFKGTFGVMQPTGDRYGENEHSRARWPDAPSYIDRVAGSPWLGREWCRRAHAGQGPIHSAFWHMFEDESLKEYAEKLGVYWPRRDLTHLHQHWGRSGSMPDFLRSVNTRKHWNESKAIFDRLKAENFASCLPIE